MIRFIKKTKHESSNERIRKKPIRGFAKVHRSFHVNMCALIIRRRQRLINSHRQFLFSQIFKTFCRRVEISGSRWIIPVGHIDSAQTATNLCWMFHSQSPDPYFAILKMVDWLTVTWINFHNAYRLSKTQ